MSAVMAAVLLIITAVIGYILFATGKLSFDDDKKKEPPVTSNELVVENDLVDPSQALADGQVLPEGQIVVDGQIVADGQQIVDGQQVIDGQMVVDSPDDDEDEDTGNRVILVPIKGLPERKKGFNEVCEVQEDCGSGLDCRPGSDNTKQCLRRLTMANLPGADTTEIPETNLGEVEEGDRFFIRNRNYGRCIGRTEENELKPSPVGYGCKKEYQQPCNPAEDAPVEDQCSYGLVCGPDEDDDDRANKCLLNPELPHYTKEKLPRQECKVWTIPCDTKDENYHWTSIDVPGTNKQKFKMVGTDQCLALRGHTRSDGVWANHMYLTLQPCDVEPQEFVQWEKKAEPAESGIVNGEVFVPDPYYSIKSATPNNQCLNMMGWNRSMPNIKPRRDVCTRSRKNSVMHFNFPIIDS